MKIAGLLGRRFLFGKVPSVTFHEFGDVVLHQVELAVNVFCLARLQSTNSEVAVQTTNDSLK